MSLYIYHVVHEKQDHVAIGVENTFADLPELWQKATSRPPADAFDIASFGPFARVSLLS